MPEATLKLRPGFVAMATQTLAKGTWWACNLVRWRWTSLGALLEKIAGWERLFDETCAGYVRAMNAYQDLDGNRYLLLGTDGGAQVYDGTGLYTFQFARRTVPIVQPGGPNVTFSSTMGSAAVKVTDVNNGVSVSDNVLFPVTMAIGGVRVAGGTTVTCATVIDDDNWTFNLPTLATSTQTGVIPIPRFFGDTGSSTPVEVNLVGHGYSGGDAFPVEVITQIPLTFNPGNGAVTAVQTLLGDYTITSVTDADNFVINVSTSGAVPTTWGFTFEGSTLTIGGSAVPGGATIVYIGSPPTNPANWFTENLGQLGLISYTNSSINSFTAPVPASGLPIAASITSAPQINSGMFVIMPQAQIMAFGTESVIGEGVQDLLLTRWCGIGTPTVWVATTTNQAGSFRLSRGTRIVGGGQTPSGILLWTDVGVWLATYIGPPIVYSFNEIGMGCGLIAPKAFASMGGRTCWMGERGFWQIIGGAVQPLVCDVADIVFEDIDRANASKCWAWANSDNSEFWFFFPSLSGGTGEIDAYVKVNLQNPAQPLWDFSTPALRGGFTRTTGIDNNVFGYPLAADGNKRIQKHNYGYDADGEAMVGAYAESGYADLGDSGQIMFVDQIIPDFNWAGQDGWVDITLRGINYPGDTPLTDGPVTATNVSKFLPVRLRKRSIAVRYEWGAHRGFSARLGADRYRGQPNGKRP